MTLYDDDLPPRVAEGLERRRFDRGHHQRRTERLEDDRDRALEDGAFELAALLDQREYVVSGRMLADLDDRIARLRGQQADLASWLPDPRLSPSMGSDERAEWGAA